MNFSSSKKFRVLAVLIVLSSSRLFAADAGSVLPPAGRQQALDKARKLLAVRESAPVTVDPFHSERFAELVAGPRQVPVAGVPAPVVASRRTDRDILQTIAATLKPSGNFIFNGEHTLVFGQKRVKAGDFLTIPFDGAEYTVEITAIERTSFTLRLNREEFTRPIN